MPLLAASRLARDRGRLDRRRRRPAARSTRPGCGSRRATLPAAGDARDRRGARPHSMRAWPRRSPPRRAATRGAVQAALDAYGQIADEATAEHARRRSAPGARGGALDQHRAVLDRGRREPREQGQRHGGERDRAAIQRAIEHNQAVDRRIEHGHDGTGNGNGNRPPAAIPGTGIRRRERRRQRRPGGAGNGTTTGGGNGSGNPARRRPRRQRPRRQRQTDGNGGNGGKADEAADSRPRSRTTTPKPKHTPAATTRRARRAARSVGAIARRRRSRRRVRLPAMTTASPRLELTVLGAGPAWSDRPGASGAAYLVRRRATAILLDLGQGSFPRLAAAIEPSALDAVVDQPPPSRPLHRPDPAPPLPRLPVRPAASGPGDRRRRAWPPGSTPSTPSPASPPTSLDCRALPSRAALTIGDLTLEARRVTHTADSHAVRLAPADGGPGSSTPATAAWPTTSPL